jgi:two-component system CheB/CheR fusion protein
MSSTDPANPSPPPATPPEANAAEVGTEHVFPVVGVGASAGGLEAFTELLEGLSPDPGLALLFAAHLDPHQKSWSVRHR